jgi:hypothetical protein
LSRTLTASFNTAFAGDGKFFSVTERGRRYWYIEEESAGYRRYVGPESPDLLRLIQTHKHDSDDRATRLRLVAELANAGKLQSCTPKIGTIAAALSAAGVFRLRAVLIGTVAYYAYSAMLGIQLPPHSTVTDDIDVAQFRETSSSIKDHCLPMLKILRQVDNAFHAVPNLHKPYMVVSYAARCNFHVDFFTPNFGADTDAPFELPALRTYARPLRLLDFLIYAPTPSVLLHDAGVYVLVPAPQRFAIHKLMIASRRKNASKQRKDIVQAQTLIEHLIQSRLLEFRKAWEEASSRGDTWRRLLRQGTDLLVPSIRKQMLAALPCANSA